MILPSLAAAAARSAEACAVCFSGKASNIGGLVSGFTWSIFFLLSVTFSVIGGLCAVVVKIERQREAAEAKLS